MGCVVQALSADTELLDRLRREPGDAVVHSVFDRVVNLMQVTGRMVTLAADVIDDAPDTVRLTVGSTAALRLRAGDRVRWRTNGWTLPDGRTVDLSGAAPWHRRLPPLPMPETSLRWLRGFLATEGVPGGAKPGQAAPGSWESRVNELLTRHLSGLLGALRAGVRAEVDHHASQLVGLGSGLTPAGDDVLLGVTLVTAMPGSTLAHTRPLLADLIGGSAGRTHDISHVALVQAVDGRTRGVLVDLLDAMTGATGDDTLTGLGRRVTAIGHTSGTDILTGVSAALDLDRELRGER